LVKSKKKYLIPISIEIDKMWIQNIAKIMECRSKFFPSIKY